MKTVGAICIFTAILISTLPLICYTRELPLQENLILATQNTNGTSNSFMRCEDGKFVGFEEFILFLNDNVVKCAGPVGSDADDKTGATHFSCLVKSMIGLTKKDSPMDKMDEFHRRLVSEKILNNVPFSQKDFNLCAVNYVINYDSTDSEQETAANKYVKCLMDTIFTIIGIGDHSGDIHKFLCQ